MFFFLVFLLFTFSCSFPSKELHRYHNLSDESIQHHWENRFPVPVSEAVLTFIDSDKVKHVLFKNGMQTEEAFRMFGTRIELQAIELGELTLTIVDLNSRDTGRYEVHDKNKALAVVIWLSGSSGKWLFSCFSYFLVKGHSYYVSSVYYPHESLHLCPTL